MRCTRTSRAASACSGTAPGDLRRHAEVHRVWPPAAGLRVWRTGQPPGDVGPGYNFLVHATKRLDRRGACDDRRRGWTLSQTNWRPTLTTRTPADGCRGALHGLRVLELGSLIGAPFCGTLMAEFGADVIKVEDPGEGDPARRLGVPLDQHCGALFAGLARNKRCITLDLRRAAGQAVLGQLVSHSDVVLENFRVGTLASWNIDYAKLSAINPRIVLAHVSGFGQDGPYRHRLAFDRIATAFSGQDWVTGFPDNPPTRPGGAVADHVAALFCTVGVMFALHHRDHVSGRGQEVDLALYEGMLRMQGSIEAYVAAGRVPMRAGNSNPDIAPAETFRTRDGQWLVLNAGTDNIWKRLLRLMGREDLDRDPRFAGARARASNHAQINAIVAQWVARHDVDELLAQLERETVPATRINSIADVAADPHVRARGNVIEAMLASGKSLTTVGVVPRLSESPGRVDVVAPAPGAHNDEVYRGLLGIDGGQIEALRRDGVI